MSKNEASHVMEPIKQRVGVSTPGCAGLVLLSVLWGSTSARVHAERMTEEQVRAAAETWVSLVPAEARPDAVIERMEPYVAGGEVVGYVAYLEGGGFCLCGADDLVLPVYYYSPWGEFDRGNPELRYFLWEIGERLQTLEADLRRNTPRIRPHLPELARRADEWQQLIAGYAPTRGADGGRTEPTLLVLPLTCQWGQGAPYNHHCPLLTPGTDERERVVVGCVATALAQTMYYWKWPDEGEGIEWTTYHRRYREDWDEEPLNNDPAIPAGWPWTGRLEWTSAGGGMLRMNGWWDATVYVVACGLSADTDYHGALSNLYGRLTEAPMDIGVDMHLVAEWNEIQDQHSEPYVPELDDAVATLCWAVGVAVEMEYGLFGSGAFTSDVVGALEDNYHYDVDATYDSRSIETMTTEILWLRPLILRGEDSDGYGHAWVVFGYDTSTDPNRLFRMNLGWYGQSDGWYTCDSIFFPLDQHHVTRIAPEGIVKFVGAGDAGDGSPDDPYEGIEEAVAEAPDGATLIFQAGSVNTFYGATLTVARPLTLKGYDVTVQGQ